VRASCVHMRMAGAGALRWRCYLLPGCRPQAVGVARSLVPGSPPRTPPHAARARPNAPRTDRVGAGAGDENYQKAAAGREEAPAPAIGYRLGRSRSGPKQHDTLLSLSILINPSLYVYGIYMHFEKTLKQPCKA
jgi:hypothetical protein